MKNIFLQKLILKNFKGIKSKTIDFRSHETNVFGANGTGKTTLFDAFTWVLFGKDSHDRKDFNVKTILENGKTIEKTEHCVIACLSVDGEEVVLTRIYKENWVKKRGEIDAELKGHETEFYVNDVPKKSGEYSAFINEIVNENYFKFITNPKYFTAQNWKVQRDILFEIAGTISDAEIANGNEAFAKLLADLNGKSVEDYKLQINAQKKKLKDDLQAFPIRIDEAEKGKPEAEDWTSIENESLKISNQIDEIDTMMENSTKSLQAINEKNRAIQSEINELTNKQAQLVADKNAENQKIDYQNKSEKREIEFKIYTAKREVSNYQKSIENLEKNKETFASQLKALGAEFDEVNASTYVSSSDGLTCPVWQIKCADSKSLEFHQNNQKKAEETFNADKVEKLNNINKKGVSLKAELAGIDGEISKYRADINKKEAEIKELEQKLAIYPSDNAKLVEVSGESIAEWKELQRKIEAKKGELVPETPSTDNSELKAKKYDLQQLLVALHQKLAKKDQIEAAEKRIAELNAEMSKVSQLISNLEKDEFVIDEFTKAKISESEARINQRFTYVQFKLFDNQLNGAVVPTCEALINGVPYSDANTASQINAGLDIINVLSKFYGVSAPVFIDNRESVSEILPTETQIVNLIVSNQHKKLTVE